MIPEGEILNRKGSNILKKREGTPSTGKPVKNSSSQGKVPIIFYQGG
jgi:hypothetical protein